MAHSIDGVCSFSLNNDIPCLILQWHGYATGSQFRRVGESQIELMKEHSLTKVLSDNREMKIVSMEDQEWTMYNWLPRALKTGYNACAIITSTDYFSRIAMENVASKIGDQLTIRYFDDIEQAVEWLKTIAV